MKYILRIFAGSLLLLSGCADNQSSDIAAPPVDSEGVIVWGQAVDGIKAGVSLKRTNQKPTPNAILVFHVQNAGDTSVKILKLSSQARFWGHQLSVEIRSSGSVVDYAGPVLEPPPPPGQSEYITLAPGELDSTERTMLLEHWGLVPPVEIDLVFVMRSQTDAVTDAVKKLWTGTVRSGVLTISIGS
ncbi:MAG: hypothetical protein KGY81_03865 [Phycisphaerae bacterium]|jgi:hypothetical protein|nr:hypothetical protein [Phycisphaerae bacterium]